MSDEYDVVVIGAGAAGLTAGLYAASHGLKTVILESMMPGNQIVNAEKIENFPGAPVDIAGATLVAQLLDQAMNAGAELEITQVSAISRRDPYRIVSSSGGDYRAKAVILAMGSALRKLGVPGEEEFNGKGVSLCATCDGPLFKDRVVAVVGGGDSAADEALTLTSYASKVFLIHRGPALRAQAYLQARVRASQRIEVLLNTTVDRIVGDGTVTGVHVLDQSPTRARDIDVSGVFVFIGLVPNTQLLEKLIQPDAAGHLPVSPWMETELVGVYAAGDLRQHSSRQLASASGDGATAAIAADRYIKANRWP
jgi:thioredoxin reductase (NADPH)